MYVFSICSALSLLLSAAPNSNDITEMQSVWKTQMSAVQSAHVTLHVISTPTGSIGRLAFLDALKTVNFRNGTDALQKLSTVVLPPLPAGEKRIESFSFFELWEKGQKKKYAIGENSNSEIITLQDGIKSVCSVSNKTRFVTIGKTGDPAIFSMRGYRGYVFIPRYSAEDVEEVRRVNGKVEIKGKRFKDGSKTDTTIDEATLMAEHKVSYLKDDVVSEVFQSGFVTYPSGVVYPSYYIESKYNKNTLTYACIAVVEKAIFNDDIPDSVFDIVLKKNDTVNDIYSRPSHIYEVDRDNQKLSQLELTKGKEERVSDPNVMTYSTLQRYAVRIGIGVVCVFFLLILAIRWRNYKYRV